MSHKVWDILEKQEYTEEGQVKIENIYDAILRITIKADNDDLKILRKALSSNLYILMDIMDGLINED